MGTTATATGYRTRVKICGLTTETDRDVAIAAGADALGFIVDVPVETPRELSPDRAATLVDGAAPFVSTVLVTMPESVGEAVILQNRVEADAIQVHGGLTPAELSDLSGQIEASVITAVDVSEPEIAQYGQATDAVLVDSTDEQGGGGTGETHDWDRAREVVRDLETPVILAGGLTPENVTDSVETVRPFGVDTATGVESEGGHKDHDAVGRFVRCAMEVGDDVYC
jgi:phosphoribosylanthranilate isomerase